MPVNWGVYSINGNSQNRALEAGRYSKLVPDDIDILLLGVGSDGHVASIFPGSNLLQDGRPSVACVSPSNGNLYDRFTFTPQLIARAKIIYLLASTENKRAMLLRCQKSNDLQLRSMPVNLLLEGIGGFEGRGEVGLL